MQAILLCNITTCCGYNTRNCNDSASCIPIFNFNRTFTVWTRMFRKGSPNPMGGLWEVAWSPAQYSSETEVRGGDGAWGLTLWMGRYIYGCIISQAIACSEKYRKKGSVERPLGHSIKYYNFFSAPSFSAFFLLWHEKFHLIICSPECCSTLFQVPKLWSAMTLIWDLIHESMVTSSLDEHLKTFCHNNEKLADIPEIRHS